MEYIVAPEVWEAFPELHTAVAVASGIRNVQHHSEVERVLADAEASLPERVPDDGLPICSCAIAAWPMRAESWKRV